VGSGEELEKLWGLSMTLKVSLGTHSCLVLTTHGVFHTHFLLSPCGLTASCFQDSKEKTNKVGGDYTTILRVEVHLEHRPSNSTSVLLFVSLLITNVLSVYRKTLESTKKR
jgi:hypothetical protein